MNPIHTVEYKGYKINVFQDEDATNPRTEYDNVATFAFFHRRYVLGDKNPGFSDKDFNGWDLMEASITALERPAAITRVYMYDHSGLTIKSSPFDCPWDSGCIGIAWVSRRKALAEMGGKILTPKIKKWAERILESEIKLYDQYLRGECYFYSVDDPDENQIDSCGGYYMSDDETLEDNEMISNGKAAVAADILKNNRQLEPAPRAPTCQGARTTRLAEYGNQGSGCEGSPQDDPPA